MFNAACRGQLDDLNGKTTFRSCDAKMMSLHTGVSESVIVGNPIPVGTGLFTLLLQ